MTRKKEKPGQLLQTEVAIFTVLWKGDGSAQKRRHRDLEISPGALNYEKEM
jgi:hypothetical protein